jgi:hypothetical protein
VTCDPSHQAQRATFIAQKDAAPALRRTVNLRCAEKKACSYRIVRVQPIDYFFESSSPKRCLRKYHFCDSVSACTGPPARRIHRREWMELAWNGMEARAA